VVFRFSDTPEPAYFFSVLYLGYKETSMIEVFLGIGVATFVVYAAFNIIYLMSMKKTGDSVSAFLKNTESNVNEALVELRGTLENLRKISGDIGAVTDDVKQISDSVAGVERSIRGLYDHLKEGLGSAAGANIAGLKAGITTGVATLVKSMQEGRREDYERGIERGTECRK
jgi:uncharacterized protein YoxC